MNNFKIVRNKALKDGSGRIRPTDPGSGIPDTELKILIYLVIEFACLIVIFIKLVAKALRITA